MRIIFRNRFDRVLQNLLLAYVCSTYLIAMIDGYPLRDIPKVNYNTDFEELLVTFANKPVLVKKREYFTLVLMYISLKYVVNFPFDISRKIEILRNRYNV